MDEANPFSEERLSNSIFEVSEKDNSRLNTRESSTLEFKLSFGLLSIAKYIKTLAAFANTRGGYIVFGIANHPRNVIGLSENVLQIFDDIGGDKITEAFNSHFAPEIDWTHTTYVFQGKPFGLIYVYESKEKPIVCLKNSDELKEGDIYYRYRARSERIKYPELRSMLDRNRQIEQQMWMDHLSQIAQIGVEDVGIFNINSGLVTGRGINSFIIDESLLSQLSFIKEGEFSEIKGKPTLKLIGNLEAVDRIPLAIGKKQIIKTRGIRISDIVLGFLDQQKVPEPQEYIKEICYQTTSLLPVYYYIYLSKNDIETTIELINSVISRSQSKGKLTEHLKNKITHRVPINDKSNITSKKKLEKVEKIKRGYVVLEQENEDLKLYLQAILSFTPEEIAQNEGIICQSVKLWFNQYYSNANQQIVDLLRRTICWVDEALYMDKCS